MRYIVEQGQTTGSRQKIVLSGCSLRQALDQVDLVPTAQIVPAGDSSIGLDDELGRAVAGRRPATTSAGTPGGRDAARRDTRARACSICSTVKRWWVEQQPFQRMTLRVESAVASSVDAAEVAPLVPDDHLVGRDAQLEPVLRPRCWSGKKSSPRRARTPSAAPCSALRRGADDAAVAPAERLEGGGGVHVGDGDDGLAVAVAAHRDRARPGVPALFHLGSWPCRPSSSRRPGSAGSPAGRARSGCPRSRP